MFVVQNSGSIADGAFHYHPEQHTGSLTSFAQTAGGVTIPIDIPHGSTNFKYFSPSSLDSNEISFNFNVEDPNATDDNGDRIRGNAYIVLFYKKDLLRSSSDDKVCGTFILALLPPKPPKDYDFFVFINNQIENSSLSNFNPNNTENALYWNNIVGTTITGEKCRTFTVSALPGYAWTNLYIPEFSIHWYSNFYRHNNR